MTGMAVVDDHPLVRDGIKRLILEAGRATRVDVFGRAEELLSALGQGTHYDVCIFDLGLPGMGGLEAIAELQNRWPELPILVLTAQPATSVAVRCIRAGARGFVSKGQDPDEFFDAIDKVRSGRRALDPSCLDLIIDAADQPESQLPHERLSNREFDIMRRLAAGETIQSIAADLCISPKTVSTYRRRCLEKMGFERNAQLTEYMLTYLNGEPHDVVRSA